MNPFEKRPLTSAILCCLILAGCSSDSSESSEPSDSTDAGDTDATAGYFDSTMYGSALKSVTQVDCTLENGSSTICHQITFLANGAGDTEGTGTVGPFCPESINTPRSEAGVGIYDGPTTPGFQSLVDAAIAMDADGYDIVDDAGNINFSDLTTMGDPSLSYCLSAQFDTSLELTYLVPVVPELRAESHVLGTIESIGFGLNGVPIKGNPPSVTVVEAGVGGTGSGNIPSLDLCGGHPDPAGYYHWHNIPQAMNILLSSEGYNYTELYGMECSNSNVAFDQPAIFSGLAKDGFPIYGAYDSVDSANVLPGEVATVDECNGHTHATAEFPDGAYHYHAKEDSAPNVPSCLQGSFVNRDMTIN